MCRVLFLIFFLACAIVINAQQAHSENIITGSGCSISNVGYLADFAKEYEKRTGIKVLVRGGGSILGLEDLSSGKVDFAASCRARTAGDPEDLQFIQVAWDALVFIVHKSNPLNSISLDEVRAIYAGKITNWKELKGRDEPIKLLISDPRKGLSGIESSAKEMIFGGKEIVKESIKSSNLVSVASTGIAEQMILKIPEGFAISGFTSARKRDVKILKVGGVSPDKKNISSGKYKLRRPLFILVPQKPKPEVKQFMDFVLSKEGQRLISSYGAVSLLDVHPVRKGGASNGVK